MSNPMTADQLLVVLKKWGVQYKEYRDWRTHNRNHKGPWGPVHGVMWHHTGSDAIDQRELLYNGYSELPGPLSQFGIAQEGTVYLIGWGRANHAGKGDPDVLRAVIHEDYGSTPPTDNETGVDGNPYFYGIEFWYSGSHAMSVQQYKSGLLLSAAICDFHGWGAKSNIGHGEWQPGKWDPGIKSGTMMDMARIRGDIRETLVIGPAPTTPPTPAPVASLTSIDKKIDLIIKHLGIENG